MLCSQQVLNFLEVGSDMKVYFAEIRIGKIGNFGISDFLTPSPLQL